MTLITTTQPYSEASRLNYSYEMKQQCHFHCLDGNSTIIFKQSSLFQFAKSLLAVSLQLSEVSCSHAGWRRS